MVGIITIPWTINCIVKSLVVVCFSFFHLCYLFSFVVVTVVPRVLQIWQSIFLASGVFYLTLRDIG